MDRRDFIKSGATIIGFLAAGVFIPGSQMVLAAHKPGFTKNGDISQLQLLPKSNWWNMPVNELPLDKRSATFTEGYSDELGNVAKMKVELTIPYNVVENLKPTVVAVTDPGYPIPESPAKFPILNGMAIQNEGILGEEDHHLIIVDKGTNMLYELYNPIKKADGTYSHSGAAIFNLKSNKLRRCGATSADAGGLPILPGLVRYDELFIKKEINHALRMTLNGSDGTSRYPANHVTENWGEKKLPLGARLRLKDSVEIHPGYPEPIQVLMRCLKKYGAIFADNSAVSFAFTGVDDQAFYKHKDLHISSRAFGFGPYDNHENGYLYGSDLELVDMDLSANLCKEVCV
ncbi:hypothetical protein ACXZ1K_15930 [Pedobacter sp. PWIIR3]